MSTKRQIVLSTALVALSVTAVGLYGRGDGGTAEGMKSHVHGATAGTTGGPGPVHIDAEGARRIGVTYAAVERKPLTRTVRAMATVQYDETRVVDVSPRIDGWIERLHVDFTGAPVRRGQPLLEVYSPALVAAQEELILARSLVQQTADAPESRAAANARRLLDAARRRLEYWDIPTDQIARLEARGEPAKTMLLRAPAPGIVVEKSAFEGARIAPGMNLYRIADLSRVWVEAEVFEKDLSLVEPGLAASVRLEAYPGEAFHGVVTYVYPTVSVEARTGRIRVELANPDLRLRPGMYAQLELAVPAGRETLVVPRTAVFGTGERDLVFVRTEDGLLAPREVTPGLPAGEEIEILEGLHAGEIVVTSASFLIDAEANLGAALSAMPGGADMQGEATTFGSAAEHAGHGSGGR